MHFKFIPTLLKNLICLPALVTQKLPLLLNLRSSWKGKCGDVTVVAFFHNLKDRQLLGSWKQMVSLAWFGREESVVLEDNFRSLWKWKCEDITAYFLLWWHSSSYSLLASGKQLPFTSQIWKRRIYCVGRQAPVIYDLIEASVDISRASGILAWFLQFQLSVCDFWERLWNVWSN